MTTDRRLPGIAHVPEVPFDPSVITYTRFGFSFEPYEYTDWIDESLSFKRTCYIGDWSPLFKLLVEGPDAIRFFADVSVNSYSRVPVGQAKHVILCNDDGKLMGEGVLMRLAEDRFLFTSGPGALWADYLFRQRSYRARARMVTNERFIFQVQGPSSLYVLEKATGESLRDIEFMRFRPARIGSVGFDLLRQGMAGELGYELHGYSGDALTVYGALLEAGREFGIRRLGGRTKMVNHVEACFPTPTVDYIPAFFGESVRPFREELSRTVPAFLRLLKASGSYEYSDISELYRTPVELGWAKNIKFDHDFIGRAALEREVALPSKTLVTLVWNEVDVIDVYASLYRKDVPFDYMEMPRNLLGTMRVDKVMKDGFCIGASTSRCYSYHFREMLSLATIDMTCAAPGTVVQVVWGNSGHPQKLIGARVAPAPYKADNRRLNVRALPVALRPGC